MIELRTLHPADVLHHQEAVAARPEVVLDLGLSDTVLDLIGGRPDWVEAFLDLASQAPEGLSRLALGGTPCDLFVYRHGKFAEVGSGEDFARLWGLTPEQWGQVVFEMEVP
jgi:hypothetical protein